MKLPSNVKIESKRTAKGIRAFATRKENEGYKVKLAKGDHFFALYWKAKK